MFSFVIVDVLPLQRLCNLCDDMVFLVLRLSIGTLSADSYSLNQNRLSDVHRCTKQHATY